MSDNIQLANTDNPLLVEKYGVIRGELWQSWC